MPRRTSFFSSLFCISDDSTPEKKHLLNSTDQSFTSNTQSPSLDDIQLRLCAIQNEVDYLNQYLCDLPKPDEKHSEHEIKTAVSFEADQHTSLALEQLSRLIAELSDLQQSAQRLQDQQYTEDTKQEMKHADYGTLCP